jgi:hypothetical protein
MEVLMEKLASSMPGISAAITALAFSGAIFFDMSFFGIIGEEFSWLASPSDYLRTAISWMPPAALTMAITAGILYYFTYNTIIVPALTATDEITKNKARQRFVKYRKISRIVSIVLSVFGFVLVCLLLLVRPRWPEIFYLNLAFIVIVPLLPLILPADRPADAISRNYMITTTLSSMIIAYLVLASIAGGLSGVKGLSSSYTDKILDDSGVKRAGNLLRIYDQGVLFYEADGRRVVLIRWDNIREIHRASAYTDQPNLRCRWLGIACGSQD